MFRILHLIFGMRDSPLYNISNQNHNRYANTYDLIKEYLEGKLSDQIRASLEAEEASENSNESYSGESKP